MATAMSLQTPTFLEAYWSFGTFRKSIGKLLLLHPEQLKRLQDLTAATFKVSESEAENFQCTAEDFHWMVAALEAVYAHGVATAGGSPERAFDELAILVADSAPAEFENTDIQSRRGILIELLQRRPELDKKAKRIQTERAILPRLRDVRFVVELRAGQDMKDEVALVPVVIARVDVGSGEIQSTQSSLVFQFTEDDLKRFETNISRVRQQLALIRGKATTILY